MRQRHDAAAGRGDHEAADHEQYPQWPFHDAGASEVAHIGLITLDAAADEYNAETGQSRKPKCYVGDLRGAGIMEWPIRILLIIGGFVIATPGGGIMPLSQWQITSLGLAILIPTVVIALVLIRRQTLVPNQLRAP